MSLESVLAKSKHTEKEIEEDFQLINELSRNYHSIENFISDIILDSSRDKWSSKEKKVRVVLTTIHSAKGLEFEEFHFLYDPSIEYSIEKLEENRRLFYTAVSRAESENLKPKSQNILTKLKSLFKNIICVCENMKYYLESLYK